MAVRFSLKRLWPSVMLSQHTPRCWMELACNTDRHTALSEPVSALHLGRVNIHLSRVNIHLSRVNIERVAPPVRPPHGEQRAAAHAVRELVHLRVSERETNPSEGAAGCGDGGDGGGGWAAPLSAPI